MTKIDGLNNRRQRSSTALPKWLAGVMLATSFILMAAAPASAETRTLKLYYTHTREKAEITFKRNGRYIQSGLKELNQFLRDWRRNEPTKMDPRLFDVIWETYRAVGARDYIHVVSAYRSPATNSMLRKRSKGVAEKSQHMVGKAMDFYIPGVKLSKLRAAALRLHGGGVGYYPKSGSPFVHLDVGNVRHWPRMSRSELAAVFPDGKTMHVPSDGKPLPGYKQALAAYKSRKKSGAATVQMASASAGGGFLSNLFGGGADDEEDRAEATVASAAPEGQLGFTVSGSSPRAEIGRVERAAPEPGPVREPELETPETIIAALPERNVPKPLFAPRPQVGVGDAAGPATLVAGVNPLDTSAGAAETQEPVEVALGIPLPTNRPDYDIPAMAEAPIPVLVAGSRAEDAAVAAIGSEAASTGSVAIAEMLTGEESPEASATLASAAPVPGQRPEWQQQVTAFAAVPELKPTDDRSPKQIALAARSATHSLKGGRLTASAGASPRLAMLGRAEGVAPAAALGTGVRTTEKAARPSAQDSGPEAKPVVVPVQQEIARWALQTGFVTRLRSAEEPARAHEAIRSAPSTVYTNGFTPDADAVDPNRFTGHAVTFLSVAKFAAN